ncbi:PilZ domain-containing protein [Catenovulum agarivorans]|uniref:PilZ domain-containing protein n=1 Tax=Catenovulum agarivorans TaxID=1172192 RepID=UPI00047453BC|nr:PilZ domain-containing protein [Catenovulum agarivorans]
MIGIDDQRSYYRMMVNADCIVVVDNLETPQEFSAICRDLSANGLAIELQESIDVGQEISVRISSASEQIPSLTARGKVLRCIPETSTTFIVGVEIIDLA